MEQSRSDGQKTSGRTRLSQWGAAWILGAYKGRGGRSRQVGKNLGGRLVGPLTGRVWGRIGSALAIFALAGCASPALTSGNERGGIISQANGTNETAAFNVADTHCHQFGRVAQVTGMDVLYNKMMFACVSR